MAVSSKKISSKKLNDGSKFNKASKKSFKAKKEAGYVSRGSTLNRRERDKIYAGLDQKFKSEKRKPKKKNKLIQLPNMDTDWNDDECSTFSVAEARVCVPPLEVSLDDPCQSSIDNVNLRNGDHIDVVDGITEKKNRREKKKAIEEREKEKRAAEERLLEKDIPRSVDEFEKLVRSSPNSSFVWLKYMAFMLSLADIEKARSIAERALRTINIREEHEKFNIWVAYFNLENEYGKPREEAVRKIFQRALQYNDPMKVHLGLLGMYERTEQHKLTDELLGKMVKKFKHSCKLYYWSVNLMGGLSFLQGNIVVSTAISLEHSEESTSLQFHSARRAGLLLSLSFSPEQVWLRQIQSLLKWQQDGVQSVCKRALICLPKHKHIKFISQTAILEFKCGVPNRGRSMFEGILREYPKRTDLWNVYLDQEIRLGDVDLIRALFERAISLSLPPKKMKSLFKKYFEYEKSHGDEERIESVKKKALNYVESTLA